MKILEAHELEADKHYWIYPKSLVVLSVDAHRVCKTYRGGTDGTMFVQMEENEFGEYAERFDDCMFIEIPRIDIKVWTDHAEEKQFEELLQARDEEE
jgi:hypothetical protein